MFTAFSTNQYGDSRSTFGWEYCGSHVGYSYWLLGISILSKIKQ